MRDREIPCQSALTKPKRGKREDAFSSETVSEALRGVPNIMTMKTSPKDRAERSKRSLPCCL